MKKLALFAIAFLASAVSFAALNPFAYGLSSKLSADETTLTVNYSLNATATAVSVVILDGETVVKTVDCADKGLTKGAYEVEIPTTDLPKTKSLTWKVEVKGESVAAPTIQSDLTLSYCLPRGIGIDRSPESPYFGRIYTTEATAGGDAYHSKEGKGLYAFEPSLTPIKNSKGGLVFTGGITYGTDDISRVVVAEDGRVFVSRFTPTDVSPVLEVNPADLNENFKDVFTTIKGKTIGIDVKGAGENLQLVMLSTAERTITEYDLGTATTWTESTPSRTYTKKDLTTEKALSLVTDNAYISYDNIDGVWLTQHRATATTTEPTIAHVIETGVDYNNFNAGLTHEGTSNGGIAISPDGKLLAVVGAGTKKLTIFDVSRDNGEIKLTSKYTISTAGNNHTALTWDYAGNLYVANRSAETITFYAMPYSGQVSTPCASKYAFQLQEEVVGTFYTVTANANDPAMGEITDNDGQYTAGATATLTAVPAAGYKFVNWTVGEETKTENPLILTVNSDLTVTANFAALPQYTITATANDAAMGTVEGAGKYYEGQEVTLKAIANPGHEFVDWNNGATEATLTFAAEKDSAVVANFKKLSYTVTAVVNDDAKGSVSGIGTYEYGATATVEAVAADGYELLYWSDRSTENPRTVTVDGNKVLNAYFIKKYESEPTFKVEKLWENTNVPAATGNGYQAVGWDGAIYMQDNGNDVVWAYTSATDSAFYTASPANSQQIAVDNAGNLVLRNTNDAFYNTTNSLLIIKKGEKEGKVVDFTPAVTGRSDFFSASGDLFSAEGGYVYIYCQNKTTVERVYIKNGAATEADVTVDVVGDDITAGNSQNHVMVDIFGNLAAHSRSNGVSSINVHNNASSKTFAATLSGIKLSTLGGCTFELGGKEFWAYNVGTTAYNSEWNLYNMTDKKLLSETAFYAKNTTDINTAANWLNVQVVDEKTAYIYQFCPKVAVAVWKVTCIPTHTVSANVNSAEAGVIAGLAKDGIYAEGDKATLTATPAEGYEFVNWTVGEDVVAETAEYTFTVTADVALVANFKEVEVEHTYTIAGNSDIAFGSAWSCDKTENDMTKQEDGTYKWEKTELTLVAGNIEFKICQDHSWDVAYPAQNYSLPISETGIYTVTITFNPATEEITATATKTGDAVVIPSIAMHGNFLGSWADTENFTLAADEATATLTLTIAEGTYEFGMRIGGSGNWTSNGVAFTRDNASAVVEAGSGNLTFTADVAGEYIFTWTFETKTLTITYPAQGPTTDIDNISIDGKTVKTIINNQLIIIKNGVQYNAQGAVVK